MGTGGDDIIRVADCREHHRPRQPMAARCFYSGRIVDRADCGMGATESVNATRRSHRRLVGFIAFYSLRWIAGIVLRKEALGMGDVLLFAALGGWVGPLSLPNVALIASCCGLIYAVITKEDQPHCLLDRV